MVRGLITQNNNQKQNINNFVSLTGTSNQIAQKFLVKAKWNFQNAINTFYDEGAPMPQPEKIVKNTQMQKFFNQNSVVQNNIRIINEEGLEKLFGGILKIDMSNIVIGHIMINIMQMKSAGQATQQNLLNLFQYTKAKSFKDIAIKIPNLQKQLIDRKDLYRKMYEGFYQFYSVTKSPTLDFDVAVQIWDTYMKGIMVYHKYFVQFLENMEKKPAKIYRDTWKMVYQFSITIKKADDYKQDQGWPIILDDFMAYLKQKNIK